MSIESLHLKFSCMELFEKQFLAWNYFSIFTPLWSKMMNDGKNISICYFSHYLCFKSFEKWCGKLLSQTFESNPRLIKHIIILFKWYLMNCGSIKRLINLINKIITALYHSGRQVNLYGFMHQYKYILIIFA